MDLYTRQNSAHSDPNPVSEATEVGRMGSLTLADPVGSSGAERPPSNGSLPSDFYAAADEIEIADEGSPVARDLAGASSLGGAGAWLEGSELDGEAPPSPSSSGYAGERGSSGASSGIEQADDPGTSLDDWSRGKRHTDEV